MNLRSSSRILVALAVGTVLGACAPATPDAAIWLVDETAAAGCDFEHAAGVERTGRLPEVMGPGVALFDVEGDGDLDLYVVNDGRNRLFVQQSSMRFVDATEASGLGDPGHGMGVAVGDVDNDGDADVYLTNLGADRLYLNRGDGTFEDATEAAGIDVGGWSSSAVFFDYDRDGRLDLYVTRYVQILRKVCTDAAGRQETCGGEAFLPLSDVLLHNRGDGTFEDVTAAAGILGAIERGLGVVGDDFDDDGWPDVFVANDAGSNTLWRNRGDGTFAERALVEGAARGIDGRVAGGGGVVAADLDDDLDTDLLLTHRAGEAHTLFANRGGSAGFDDASAATHVSIPTLPDSGFGVAAIDLELDGDLDLVTVNGRVVHGEDRASGLGQANRVMLNDGHGVFEPAGTFGGGASAGVSRGLASGDLDGDGDLDLVVADSAGALHVYRTEAPREGHWLLVRVVDPALGRDAIGARVVLTVGSLRRARTVQRGGSFQSSSDPRVHFAARRAVPATLEVRWPDGARESFDVESWDAAITLRRGEGRPAA